MSNKFLLGQAIASRFQDDENVQTIHRANRTIDEMNRRYEALVPEVQLLRDIIATKRSNPQLATFDVRIEMQPDEFKQQTDNLIRSGISNGKPLTNRDVLWRNRRFNMRLYTWSEWWHESMKGGAEMRRELVPKMKGLSFHLRIGMDPVPISRALEDLAARMSFFTDMDNPREWVEARVTERMKTAKWKTDDPTIPIVQSFEQAPTIVNRGEDFEPFNHNLYGIGDMAMK